MKIKKLNTISKTNLFETNFANKYNLSLVGSKVTAPAISVEKETPMVVKPDDTVTVVKLPEISTCPPVLADVINVTITTSEPVINQTPMVVKPDDVITVVKLPEISDCPPMLPDVINVSITTSEPVIDQTPMVVKPDDVITVVKLPEISDCPPMLPEIISVTLLEESVPLPEIKEEEIKKIDLKNIQMNDVLDFGNNENVVLNDEYKNLFTENNYGNWILDGKTVVENSIYNVYNGIGDCSTIKILIEDNIEQNPII